MRCRHPLWLFKYGFCIPFLNHIDWMGLANGDCGISCDLLLSYSLPPHLNRYFYSRIVSKIVISFVAFEPPHTHHIASHKAIWFYFTDRWFWCIWLRLICGGHFCQYIFSINCHVSFDNWFRFVSFRFVFVNDCIDELMMHITAWNVCNWF